MSKFFNAGAELGAVSRSVKAFNGSSTTPACQDIAPSFLDRVADGTHNPQPSYDNSSANQRYNSFKAHFPTGAKMEKPL